MNIAAIPTVYKNVRFRSRLEAKWAAFFDLVGWEWEYEPLDYDGWIPDFIFRIPNDSPVLVEVKPIISTEDPLIEEAWTKINKCYPYLPSVNDFSVLLLGAILEIDPLRSMPLLGSIRSDGSLVDSGLLKWKYGKGIGFTDRNSWRSSQYGKYDITEDEFSIADFGEVNGLFRSAGNFVQWRG